MKHLPAPVSARLLSVLLLALASLLGALILLLMGGAAARWDGAWRDSLVSLDRLAQSRQYAIQAELFAERLVLDDPASSPELVLASLERAIHNGRALVEGGSGFARLRANDHPSPALREAVEQYLAVLKQMADRVRERIQSPERATSLRLRQLHAPLQQTSRDIEKVLQDELERRRATLREVGLFASVLLAALMLGILLVRYRAEVAREEARREHLQSDARIRLHAAVLEGTRDGVMVTDPQIRIVSVNRAFSGITGYAEEELIGKTPEFLRSGRDDAQLPGGLSPILNRDGHWQGEVRARRRSGEIDPLWMTVSAVADASGKCTHYVCVLRPVRPDTHVNAPAARGPRV